VLYISEAVPRHSRKSRDIIAMLTKKLPRRPPVRFSCAPFTRIVSYCSAQKNPSPARLSLFGSRSIMASVLCLMVAVGEDGSDSGDEALRLKRQSEERLHSGWDHVVPRQASGREQVLQGQFTAVAAMSR